MAQEYWCCYYNYYEKTKRLNDEQLGRLFRALMQYAATGELVEPTGPEALAFDFIADDIARQNKAYEEKCFANRMNGNKGGRPKKEIAIETDGLFINRAVSEKPKAFQETLIKEEEKEEEEQKKNNSIKEAKASLCYAPVVDAWNSLPDGIAKINGIVKESTREKLLTKRIRDYSMDSVMDAIEKVRQSKFLQGVNNKGWSITFDWFVKPNNFQKVLDGNYDERGPKHNETDRVQDELEEWKEEMRRNGFN